MFVGVVVFAALIRFPPTEGRAANLDLLRIYADPFILYVYATSIVFFVALYTVFKLPGYIGQNKGISSDSVQALRNIKYCAVVLSVLIVAAGAYIKIAHNMDDDPVGFLAICAVATFAAIIVATTAARFEKILQRAVDVKSESDPTR